MKRIVPGRDLVAPALMLLLLNQCSAEATDVCVDCTEREGDASVSDADADADAADAGVDAAPGDTVDDGTSQVASCSTPSIDDCRDGEMCVESGVGYCGESLGHCAPNPTDCPSTSSLLRGCTCGSQSFESLCAARQAGGARVYLCTEATGVSCDTASSEDCGDGFCVARPCLEPPCEGVCVPLDAACAGGPDERVCATSSPGFEAHAALETCWDSVCDAWQDGYRGALAFYD